MGATYYHKGSQFPATAKIFCASTSLNQSKQLDKKFTFYAQCASWAKKGPSVTRGAFGISIEAGPVVTAYFFLLHRPSTARPEPISNSIDGSGTGNSLTSKSNVALQRSKFGAIAAQRRGLWFYLFQF